MKRIGLIIILINVLVLSACVPPKECSTCEGPSISGPDEVNIPIGTTFDLKDYYEALDDLDGDMTDDLQIDTGDVDGLVEGEYPITISVTDSDKNKTTKDIIVHVGIYLAQYPNGIDLSNLPGEEKANIMAQMEAFMLENMIGGVPLYRSARYYLHASRLELFSQVNSNVLGFGEAFSSLSEDDSTVLINGVQGNVGEFTFRDIYFHEPTTLNPYEADDSATEMILEMFHGSLYDFYYNEDKTSYEFRPEHASQMPIPVDGVEVDHKIVSYTWQIPLRDNLVWTFHPDTDVSSFEQDYEVLNAEDYLWTWKLGLENEWFRAVAGGGDFATYGVKNAQAYLDGNASIEDIGIRLVEDQSNVIEIEFEQPQELLRVLYMLTLIGNPPINQDLYENIGQENYGTSPQTVASSGPYYLSEWTPNEEIYFVKNENFVYEDMIQYTGYHYLYLEDEAVWLDEFLAGNLEYVELTTGEADNFFYDERLFIGQNTSSWGLQINGFGSEEIRDAYIEKYSDFGINDSYVPEPILGYLEMKHALFYAIDRQELIDESALLAVPNYTYFPDQYIVDLLSGHTVRTTSLGQAVKTQYDFSGLDISPIAVGLFQEAVELAIEDGYYTPGTEANPTIIEIELKYKGYGSETMTEYLELLESMLEEVLYDEVNHVGIDITLFDATLLLGNVYHNFTGEFDLYFAGLSDYMPHLYNIAERYRDDNFTGFTMNFGIDTSSPNLDLTYTNYDGDIIREIWSYNALCDALREEVFIEDGIIKTTWEQPLDLIEAYLRNLDLNTEEVLDGTSVFEILVGSSIEDYKVNMGITQELEVYIADTDEFKFVFILSLEDEVYKKYDVIKMYTDLEDAIDNYITDEYGESYSGLNIDSIDGEIENDLDVMNNDYLSSIGITSYQALLDELEGVDPSLVRFHEVTWSYGWSDVMAVIEIDGYYVGWYWY